VSSVKDCLWTYGTIDVYDLKNVDFPKLKIGQVDAMSGEAAFSSVKKVIELALAKEIDATITNPLNKEAINAAGHHYAGHTEIYADLTGAKDYSMMLADGELRVVHVSTHVSLREACDRVKKARVLQVIRLADLACKSLGIEKPRVAVAGLNPHAGENGMFGTEEIAEIIPAVREAKAEGIEASGPIPPDTLFSKAAGGMYDIVVAMYHDQGHIPLKVLGFQYDREKDKWKAVNGVNITLGLPIIRSSVDHGTAFGHAWQGSANESSLVNAIDYGIRLANNKEG
jgi:4-hydroxythreonine-4-phosphate dehydrogenase